MPLCRNLILTLMIKLWGGFVSRSSALKLCASFIFYTWYAPQTDDGVKLFDFFLRSVCLFVFYCRSWCLYRVANVLKITVFNGNNKGNLASSLQMLLWSCPMKAMPCLLLPFLVFSFMAVQWHLVCEEFVSLLYNYSLLITIITNSHCYYIRFVVKYVLVCSNKTSTYS